MAMLRKDFHQERYQHLTAETVPLTKKEKTANWWYYHKWHVIIGIVLLLCVIDLVKTMLGIGEVKPDYQIAYVGTNSLPDETVSQLENLFTSIGEDFNQDGTVTVQINQYASNNTDDNSESSYYQYASEVSLISDIQANESFFFLMEDPESFEEADEALAYIDGSLPEEGADDYENMCISWSDSKLLSSYTLGEYTISALGTTSTGSSDELVGNLYIGRRGFWTDTTCENEEGCEALWNKIIGG